MYAPGIVGLVFALVVLLFMRDNPENFGHAPVQAPKPKNANPSGDPRHWWCRLHRMIHFQVASF